MLLLLLTVTLFATFNLTILMGVWSYRGVPIAQVFFVLLWVSIVAPFVAVALQ